MPKRPSAAVISTVAEDEIARFSRDAGDWWNPHGKFRPLHRLNPLRLGYVRDAALAHFGGGKTGRTPLKGLSILDVGCGGGLLSEPMARMGADVTGLDASAEAIAVARRHAEEVGVAVDYKTGSVEAMARSKKRFDVITALEIVEHVADADAFIAALVELLKPDGLLVMSTLNRTPKSFMLGIVAAEYILGWVPRGTHSWTKFIRPSELVKRLDDHGTVVQAITGVVYNPLTSEFELSGNDLDVNYMLTAVRK
jgi:2-polyprenyl-6-hydroxyphenyl methylase/3-demethylubiquinone-9 3-methyltransferase